MNTKGYVDLDEKLVVYHHQNKEEESEMCKLLVKQWIKDYRTFRNEAERYKVYTYHIHVWDDKAHLFLAFGNRIEVEDMPHLQGKGFDVMSAKCIIDINKDGGLTAYLLAPLLNEAVRILEESKKIIRGYGFTKDTGILDLAFWAYNYNDPHTYTVDRFAGASYYDEGAVIIDDKGRLYDLGLTLKNETAQNIWQDMDEAKLELNGLKKFVPRTINRFDLPPSRSLTPLSAEEKIRLENEHHDRMEAIEMKVDKEFDKSEEKENNKDIPY